MEKVSVIITSFNKGRYIDRTIESVKNQTYNNIEVIIVDDCSTDRLTLNKLELLNKNGEQIIFLEKNLGVSEARNIGIRKSKGRYILIIDGDDLISNSYIEKAVEIIEKDTNVKIVTCEVELFGYKKGKMKLSEPKIENLIAQNSIIISSLFRREDFDKTSGFNANMNKGLEDWDFWLTMLENGGTVHRIPQVHFYYRISKKSRNNLDAEKLKTLRKQIYLNHKFLYSKHMLDPIESFEYNLILNSWEYKIGKLILKPIRFMISKLKM